MKLLDPAATEAGLPFPALIEALRRAFQADVTAPERHHHALPGGATLLLMPAWRSDCLGVKVVTVHPANASAAMQAVHGTYLLSEARSGAPIAILDGDVLTARRTAAASALAASFLARKNAARLLVVGAGRVASLMPEAHRAVRPIATVEVWNRTPERAGRLALQLQHAGFEARAVTDLEAAVAGADFVSCATLAREPVLRGEWLRPGTHLDLVGAFRPEMREADADAVRRASVFIDTEAALHEAGELAERPPVQGTLASLCRGEAVGRRSEAEITLFKSTGTALEDLAGAMLAVGLAPN